MAIRLLGHSCLFHFTRKYGRMAQLQADEDNKPLRVTMNTKSEGFTLVELSIVLVILGLLVGGVLTGQSLIRAAELRSFATDGAKFTTAIYAFKDKYFALPGDMANATSFWGSLGGTGSDATCQNIAATGQATCNGNGDGMIIMSVVDDDEPFRFWQHLANAGLIEGRWPGRQGGSFSPGVNMPGSKLGSKIAWYPLWSGSPNGSVNRFIQPMGNGITAMTGYGDLILKPEEVWNIDMKQDDGLPGTGNVMVYKNTTGNCTTATNTAPPGDAGATYVLSNQTKQCMAVYWRGNF